MSRYCSIAKYKAYIDSLKNIKDLNARYFKPVEEIKLLCGISSRATKLGVWKELVENISYVNAHIKNGTKAMCVTAERLIEEKKIKSSPRQKIRPKLIRKEFQKLCINLQKKISQNKVILASTAVSVSSLKTESPANVGTKVDPIIEPIPEPPAIPEASGEILDQVNALGEATFVSLGLGGHSPVGLAQHCFEYLHVTLGVEWWLAIAIGTLFIRLCLFPLVIITQRNAAKMNNYLPQMQLLQHKMSEARQTGNQMDAARYSQELMLFMKEKQLNPLKNMIVPLCQMPIFISFFMALRQMANVPVDSLRTGGLWWFTDLTLPDQYFLLPIITSLTLLVTIEIGTDTAKLSAQNMHLMKYALRGLPLVILPFTFNFPGAILCYWVSSNFISLVQVGFLRIPKVRDYFNIERMEKIDPSTLPIKPKGFTEGIKDSWTNMKITKELEERRRLDEIQFQRAGKGPIVKTYKYDPTKRVEEPFKAAPVSAKSR